MTWRAGFFAKYFLLLVARVGGGVLADAA